MTRFLVTLLLVSIPYFLMFVVASSFWNDHDRQGAIGFTFVVVMAVIIWQGAWGWAG